MSTVICGLFSLYLVVSVKVFPCLRCCMCWFLRVLAVNIRANPRIIGLSFPGAPAPLSPISQYVDDTVLAVCSDDSITATFETYSL